MAGAVPLIPRPNKRIACGPPAALSTIVMRPRRLPAAVGVNVTLTVQPAEIATDAPQLLVWAKLPLAVMLATVSAVSPLLVRVILFAALVVLRL